jgi:sensor c-di-GMP phosphodiesterase-like protein
MMCEGLNLKVIAEGIETEEQAEMLRSLGCKSGQGWLYGKAVDSAETFRLIEAQQEARFNPPPAYLVNR